METLEFKEKPDREVSLVFLECLDHLAPLDQKETEDILVTKVLPALDSWVLLA